MESFVKKLKHLLIQKDIWIFVGLTLLITIASLNEHHHPNAISWKEFFMRYLILQLFQLPILFYVWNKTKLKNSLSLFKFILISISFLILYPVFSTLLEIEILKLGIPYLQFRTYYEGELVTIIHASSVFTFGVLSLNTYYKSKPKVVQWIQKIGFERALLGTFAFISILFGSFAGSNFGFLVEQHQIHADINFDMFFPNFFHFISFSFQFALHFSALYFFYYINRYLLIPKLLKTKGILHFLAGMMATTIVFFPLLTQVLLWLPINHYLDGFVPGGNINPFAPENGAVAFLTMLLSTPVILVADWFKQNAALTQLQKEKAETELSLLKQQINPHFFFNTLNNLYALSIQKSMQTPEVILQLSELMRYVIYRGKEDTVALEEEIKYIEDYIQLQQIRLKKKLNFQIDKSISDGNLQIPPLLFIILVENAFKHGIEPAEESAFLDIIIEATEKEVTFYCKNSYELLQQKNGGGLGLTNLKRRLNLRYPKKHELTLYDDDFTFEAIIKLDLS